MTDTSSAVLLTNGWAVSSRLGYVLAAFGSALLVRVIVALLKSFERSPQASFVGNFVANFSGRSIDGAMTDYWYPFVLGVLEFAAYPILMFTGNWNFIGAWLAFKTLAQWKHWAESRPAFNRFLIGNALVIILSFGLMLPFVRKVNPPPAARGASMCITPPHDVDAGIHQNQLHCI